MHLYHDRLLMMGCGQISARITDTVPRTYNVVLSMWCGRWESRPG